MKSARVVYVANAKTKDVDKWLCEGKLRGVYQGKPETLCILVKGSRSTVLPERCVFASKEAALAALEK